MSIAIATIDRSALEVEQCWVASTCHIEQHDTTLFGTEDTPLVVYEKAEYGYWVFLPRNDKLWREMRTALMASGHSQVFKDLVCAAHDLGFHWLILDRDGPKYDFLPYVEW